jgi:hypothetical protein
MSSGHELPMNPYSDIPPTDASPKPSEGRRRTVLYVLHIAVTVAIMFFAPQPAKIVTIAAWLLTWAIFNTWKKDLPALAGGWTSFSMFVITVLASWISSGTMQYSHVQDVMALQYHFRSIESSLEYHHKTHGSYPSALSDPPFEFPNGNDSYQLKDPWNRSILYTVEGDGFRLSSFGRDGVPGGIGLDADWSYHSSDAEPYRSPFRNTPDIQLSLRQFLFDTPSTFGILFPGLWLFLALGHAVRSESKKFITSRRAIVVTAVIVTVIGATVCTFLSMFHIAASQSSH